MDRTADSRCGNRAGAVHPEGHENRIGDFQPLSFWCDDVFATAKAMKSKGVEFEKDPKAEPWGTSAIFKDVDGNKFVLSSK
jgi:predicted enzyme related to lactoylglutathione lyase